MRKLLLVFSFIAACGVLNSGFAQKIEEIALRDFTKCSADNKSTGYATPCKDALASTDVEKALALSAKQNFSLHIEGDTLLLAAKVVSGDIQYAGKPYLCCDIQAYLDPIADGIYAAKFRWKEMDKSLLELSLMNVAQPSSRSITYNGSGQFPDPLSNTDKSVLKNAGMELTEHAFEINQEFGMRKVTVIKGDACLLSVAPCQVIYTADGKSLEFMVKSALLDKRDLSRFVFVGIHTSEDKEHAINIRIEELLFGYNPARYDAFMHFVTVTLVQQIERQTAPLARYSAGYSNGGAWALDMLLDKPDIFSGAIIMSPAQWQSRTDTRLPARRVFVGAGQLETSYHANAHTVTTNLRARGALVQETYVPSGHSMNTWSNVWSRSLLALSQDAPVQRP